MTEASNRRRHATPGATAPTEPSLRIGRAQPDDAFRIAGLLRAAAPDCVPMALRDVHRRWRQFKVVRDRDHGVIAAASLRPVERRRVELRGLVVDSRYHGCRLGSRLVARAVDRCLRAGVELVCVTRRPSFFARLGFEALPFRRIRSDAARGEGRRRVAMVCVATLQADDERRSRAQ